MHLSKAGQPDYKLADQFINRRPIYKLVRLTIGSQHIYYFKIALLQFHTYYYSTIHVVCTKEFKNKP